MRETVKFIVSEPRLAVVIAESFLARLAFSVITFALPFYALSLGMSITEVGVLAALRIIVALVMKPVMGRAADRFGIKPVYLASIAGRALVALLFICVSAPWALFLVRGLHGVTTAARDPTSALLVMEHADERRVASAFSWFATAKTAGAALGFPIAGLFLAWSGDSYAGVFAFAALISAVAFLLVWCHAQEPVSSHDEAPEAQPRDEGALSEGWIRYAALAFMIALPAGMVGGLFPLIVAAQTSLGKAEIGFVYAISTAVTIIVGPYLGWLADHVSRSAILAVRSGANVLSSVFYLVLPGFWGMTAARVMDDTGKAAFAPAWGSMMAEIARREAKGSRARRVSQLDTAESAGDALGPALAGVLWENGGLMWLFGVRILIAIGAEIYAVFVLRRALS